MTRNRQRNDKLLAESELVRDLVRSGMTVAEIAKDVCVPASRVRKLAAFHTALHPTLLERAVDGTVSSSVALGASTLPGAYQLRLIEILAETGKLTVYDVRNARRAATHATTEWPADLFPVSPAPYPLTVQAMRATIAQAFDAGRADERRAESGEPREYGSGVRYVAATFDGIAA